MAVPRLNTSGRVRVIELLFKKYMLKFQETQMTAGGHGTICTLDMAPGSGGLAIGEALSS